MSKKQFSLADLKCVMLFFLILMGCNLEEESLPLKNDITFIRYTPSTTTFAAGQRIQNFPTSHIHASKVPRLMFRFEWLDPIPTLSADAWFNPTFIQPDQSSFSLSSTLLQIQMVDSICNGNYRIWVVAAIDTVRDSLDFDYRIKGGESCGENELLDSLELNWPELPIL